MAFGDKGGSVGYLIGQENGGIAAMERANIAKAELLYAAIDAS